MKKFNNNSAALQRQTARAIQTANWRKAHPLKRQRQISKARGLGFNPITSFFPGAEVHHLHLENTNEHAVYLPRWIHEFNRHNSKTGKGMDTINALALDYFVNELMYQDLYELSPAPLNPDDILEDEIDFDTIPIIDAIPWGQLIDTVYHQK